MILQTVDLLIPASLSVFVYAMGYIGLRRPEVLTGMDDLPPSPRRYEKSTLTLERSDTYLQRLLDLMNTEKPYLDGELTLQKLAKAAGNFPTPSFADDQRATQPKLHRLYQRLPDRRSQKDAGRPGKETLLDSGCV